MEHYAMTGLKEVSAQQIADDAITSAIEAYTKGKDVTRASGEPAAILALAAAIESGLCTLAQAIVYHADAVASEVEA